MSYVVNKQYYDRPEMAEYYGMDTSLWKSEEAILLLLQDEIKDRPLLEIGVGAGRTTPYLKAISDDYIGIDYSLNMIKLCRQRNPDAMLAVADARHMTLFNDELFTAVFWCFNGIDDVDAGDRMLILNEVRRVLSADGIFVFSSHNLDCKSAPPFSLKRFIFGFNRIKRADNAKRLRSQLRSLLACIKKALFGKEHAIIHEYEGDTGMVLPTYYIGKPEQIRQLLNAGFADVRAFGMDGHEIHQDRSAVDLWVYYVARKRAS